MPMGTESLVRYSSRCCVRVTAEIFNEWTAVGNRWNRSTKAEGFGESQPGDVVPATATDAILAGTPLSPHQRRWFNETTAV